MLIISVIFLLKLCNLCYSVVYNENTIKCSTVQPTEVSITEFYHYWSGHIRDLIMLISNSQYNSTEVGHGELWLQC